MRTREKKKAEAADLGRRLMRGGRGQGNAHTKRAKIKTGDRPISRGVSNQLKRFLGSWGRRPGFCLPPSGLGRRRGEGERRRGSLSRTLFVEPTTTRTTTEPGRRTPAVRLGWLLDRGAGVSPGISMRSRGQAIGTSPTPGPASPFPLRLATLRCDDQTPRELALSLAPGYRAQHMSFWLRGPSVIAS